MCVPQRNEKEHFIPSSGSLVLPCASVHSEGQPTVRKCIDKFNLFSPPQNSNSGGFPLNSLLNLRETNFLFTPQLGSCVLNNKLGFFSIIWLKILLFPPHPGEHVVAGDMDFDGSFVGLWKLGSHQDNDDGHMFWDILH
jgi:hypothetical protein